MSTTPSINQIQDEILSDFEPLEDWLDRYEVIIEMGEALPPMPEEKKTPENLISGCQSRVWIAAERDDEGRIRLQAESDAMIVKGIAALLVKVLSGHTASEIVSADLYFIDKLGLRNHLSPTRSNGLASMIDRIRAYAQEQE